MKAVALPAAAGLKKVVIAGNPNAGKTTLFNALTRSHLRTGNFHGVTTSPSGKAAGGFYFVDVPGLYSFNGYTMEEESASREIASADIIINVVDATNLDSALALTRKLQKSGKRVVVYLTKLSKLKARGGWVDEEKLTAFLGAEVTSCTPKKLKETLDLNKFIGAAQNGEIALNEAYYGGNCEITPVERLFYNRFFALAFFVAALTFTFFITFYPGLIGAALKDWTEELITVKLSGAVCSAISNPALASLVGEGIFGGVGGVIAFIPQISILYLCLILLDESGVSSALAFATDGLFEKVGLSGRAAFSLVSGFGCTAAAIATTRGYAKDETRYRTVAVLPFIPCGAKTPVFLTFLSPLFKNPFPAVCALYFGGVLLAVIASAIIKRGGEDMISEIAPVCLPQLKTVVNKLFFQIKSFIIKVTTVVFAFCLVSWLLSHFSIEGYCAPAESFLGDFSRLLTPLFYPMGITDWRISFAALSGFAAKENVAATIALLIPEGLALALPQTAAACVFFLTCPACISAFASSVREIGLRRTLKYNAAQLAFAFAAAYLTFFIFKIL